MHNITHLNTHKQQEIEYKNGLLTELSYQIMHWATVPVRTDKRTVIVGEPVDKEANKARKLAGRNGHKTTETSIKLTNVDFGYMVEKVTELCISQFGCQLKSTTTVIITTYSLFTNG